MPDYEIDAAKKEVAVRLYGNAINEKYTKLLKENKDLSLEDCILLDAVQKGHRLSESDAKNLLERGLVGEEKWKSLVFIDDKQVLSKQEAFELYATFYKE